MKLTDKQKKLVHAEIRIACCSIQEAANDEMKYLKERIIEIIEKDSEND